MLVSFRIVLGVWQLTRKIAIALDFIVKNDIFEKKDNLPDL